ncbi:hypothetical protein PABG_00024 [Paracoccidioides brasiliensis Pb03]|nr:hypothetical protein PABG_00024 [Paracoccidioides brasiliensis Pb03]
MCEDITEIYDFCRHRGESYVRPCLDGVDCEELISVDLIIMSFCPCCFGMAVDNGQNEEEGGDCTGTQTWGS